jgi:hypothetical protein
MTQPLDIIIVERLGSLKVLSVKDFKFEELFKKCGFKKSEDFTKQTEWNVKLNGNKYLVQLYAKVNGRPNSENKYDFPPPVDTKLFYGSCALVGQIKNSDGSKVLTHLSLSIWERIYEKLFGGFEDLAVTAKEDENEEDELANVPKEKKTKDGYLKDGFVVDSSDTDEKTASNSDTSESEDTDENSSDLSDEKEYNSYDEDDDLILENIGSELSEEAYDYDDKDVGK